VKSKRVKTDLIYAVLHRVDIGLPGVQRADETRRGVIFESAYAIAAVTCLQFGVYYWAGVVRQQSGART